MANILACIAIGPDCRKCETRNERCRIPCLAAQLVPTAQTDLPPRHSIKCAIFRVFTVLANKPPDLLKSWPR